MTPGSLGQSDLLVSRLSIDVSRCASPQDLVEAADAKALIWVGDNQVVSLRPEQVLAARIGPQFNPFGHRVAFDTASALEQVESILDDCGRTRLDVATVMGGDVQTLVDPAVHEFLTLLKSSGRVHLAGVWAPSVEVASTALAMKCWSVLFVSYGMTSNHGYLDLFHSVKQQRVGLVAVSALPGLRAPWPDLKQHFPDSLEETRVRFALTEPAVDTVMVRPPALTDLPRVGTWDALSDDVAEKIQRLSVGLPIR